MVKARIASDLVRETSIFFRQRLVAGFGGEWQDEQAKEKQRTSSPGIAQRFG